jgi:hypothetical protein
MKIFFKLLICLTVGAFCSCQNKGGITEALSLAGKNEAELKKVLEHYASPADSLKLKAAQFLIVNMPGHNGYYGNAINKFSNIFSIIDTQTYIRGSLSNDEKAHIGDSVISIYGNPDLSVPEAIEDNKLVSANYLIVNIDYAFKAWKKAPWCKDVSFNDFCEYILPYRIRSEQVQYWRPAFYRDYTKMAKAAPDVHQIQSVYKYMNDNLNSETNFTVFFNKYFPFTQSISDVIKGKIGGCETTTFYSATAMRSAGLPVSVDYIPHWGSTNSRHYMVHLINRKNKPELISNENVQQSTWNIVDFSSEYSESRHKFTKDELPFGMTVQYVKTIPKIYRFNFSSVPELRYLNDNFPKESIAPEFRKINLKDVTDEYIHCGFNMVTLGPGFDNYKQVYLCVFDINGWQPVAVSNITSHRAIFDKLGFNTVYLSAVYNNGTFIPTSSPFYIDSLNIAREFKPEAHQRQNFKIVRKSPLYSYSAYHTELLKGGRFEGANTADFAKPTVLYSINTYPFYMNEVKVDVNQTFRYLRYVAPAGGGWEADNIAEVQFYDNAASKPLAGDFIGKAGISGHEIKKAFDNDMNSFYQNAFNKNGWIGIDLGKHNEKKVTMIRFCPRNDTNCIMPHNTYELFYWDNKWISLGLQTANGYELKYTAMPENCLFWLRCKSGGTEERIFTIENGKQVWW